jgi:hypothetical protein
MNAQWVSVCLHGSSQHMQTGPLCCPNSKQSSGRHCVARLLGKPQLLLLLLPLVLLLDLCIPPAYVKTFQGPPHTV